MIINMYTKDGCHDCERARKVLTDAGVQYQEHSIFDTEGRLMCSSLRLAPKTPVIEIVLQEPSDATLTSLVVMVQLVAGAGA